MRVAIRPLSLAVVLLGSAACENDATLLRAIGQLESDRLELAVEFAEPIVERPAVEGQRVGAAGELLLRQDDQRMQARLAELEAALGEQRARLAELTRGPRQELIVAEQANVAGARQEAEFRRNEYRRVLDLAAKELASPDNLDKAKAALDAAESALDVREAKLAELLAGTTVEELQRAENAVNQAAARLAAGRIDQARHAITAPVDGLVDSLLFEVGERPPPNVPAIVLLTGDQPYARVFVPESIRARVQPGMSARVSVDGVAQPVTGTVRWVSSEAAFTPYFALTEHDRGRLTYPAKIDLDLDADRLPDGVPVEAEFLLD